MEYGNAAEILPDDLVREIQRYFPCGMLWVPKTGEHHKLRMELITKLLEKGEPVRDVAALSGYTERRIRDFKRNLKRKKTEQAEKV